VIGEERWRDNWHVVSPPGAVRVDLGRSGAKRRATRQRVRDLATGTPVVLFAAAPGASGRCRRFASGAGVELEREYLVFPSLASPAYLVEDAPAPVGVFVQDVLVTPPRVAFALPIEAGLRVLRAFNPWRLLRLIAPGRVVVGRRA